jgi:hypothetical protein
MVLGVFGAGIIALQFGQGVVLSWSYESNGSNKSRMALLERAAVLAALGGRLCLSNAD